MGCDFAIKGDNMKKTKELIEKLSWDEPECIQKETIETLKHEKDLGIFMQPISSTTGKQVWENCALILCSKSDEELIPYIDGMFEWLQDMNWPGAWNILERIQKIPKEKIKTKYELYIKKANEELEQLGEEVYMNSWLSNLEMINTHFKKEWFF